METDYKELWQNERQERYAHHANATALLEFNEKLRLENERLNHLIEQAHNVVSELIDGSRMQNVERCGAWEIKKRLGEAVSAYYGKQRANTVCTGQERSAAPEVALSAPAHSPAQGG